MTAWAARLMRSVRGTASTKRIGLSLLCLALGYKVTVEGVAASASSSNPSQALLFSPDNAEALALAAASRISLGQTPGDIAEADRLARASLLRSPALADSYGALGLVADVQEHPDRAMRLMKTSDALSRRNLPTRLWLIEEAVSRGDVAGALDNFDVALRTSKEAKGILFPVLQNALSDPALQKPIHALLRRSPPWRSEFVYDTANSGNGAADLALAVRGIDLGTYGEVDLKQMLLSRILEQNKFREAYLFAASSLPPPDPAQSVVDPLFRDSRGDVPFNWRLTSSDGLYAERGTPPAAGLQITLNSGDGGILASQLLRLGPGRYTFSATAGASSDPAGPALSLTVSCAEAAKTTFAAMKLTPQTATSTRFDVPSGCSAQWLTLSVAPSGETENRTLQLQNVMIRPA